MYRQVHVRKEKKMFPSSSSSSNKRIKNSQVYSSFAIHEYLVRRQIEYVQET